MYIPVGPNPCSGVHESFHMVFQLARAPLGALVCIRIPVDVTPVSDHLADDSRDTLPRRVPRRCNGFFT